MERIQNSVNMGGGSGKQRHEMMQTREEKDGITDESKQFRHKTTEGFCPLGLLLAEGKPAPIISGLNSSA